MTASARPLAVFDIDGVVANVTHRLHHLQARPARWDAFFAGAAQDPLLAPGLAAVRLVQDTHDVVWMSGRPERIRQVTRGWLEQHDLPVGGLHLRPDRDRSPARRLKQRLLTDLADGRQVAVVVDDDDTVVEALRAAGWPVQHADWAPRARRGTLHRAQRSDGRT